MNSRGERKEQDNRLSREIVAIEPHPAVLSPAAQLFWIAFAALVLHCCARAMSNFAALMKTGTVTENAKYKRKSDMPAPHSGAKGKKRPRPETEAGGAAAGGGGGRRGGGGAVLEASKYVAMDCEMVGVGADGKRSMLARVSLVDGAGATLYDKFVRPMEKVTDYRTHVSGVRPQDLRPDHGAVDFRVSQKEVAALLKGRVLVGHALHNDLKVLMMDHPPVMTRDTGKYWPLMKPKRLPKPGQQMGTMKPRPLRVLAKVLLRRNIQGAEHSSVEDAVATLDVYRTVSKMWEKAMAKKRVAGLIKAPLPQLSRFDEQEAEAKRNKA